MAEFVEEKRNQGYQDVVIVSHDHPIRMGIGKLMNRPPITWEDMHLDNGSITILEHTDAQWRLVPEYVNWRPNMTAVRLRGFAEKLFNLLFRYNRSGERQSAD
jgi:broad specificity phosphatase PhoE